MRNKKILLVLILVMASLVLGDNQLFATGSCPYKYPDGTPCGGILNSSPFGQDYCTNPDCPGPPKTGREDGWADVSLGNIRITSDVASRWERRFGTTGYDSYIDAVRKVHPALQDKEITITIGPSNEFEFFSDGDSITHLVWPVIEGIRNERIARIPVVEGYYESGLHLAQDGKKARFSTRYADGRTLNFSGDYQDVTIAGITVRGFFGLVEGTVYEGYQMLIQPIFGPNPGIVIYSWYRQNGAWYPDKRENTPSVRDAQGKARSPRM